MLEQKQLRVSVIGIIVTSLATLLALAIPYGVSLLWPDHKFEFRVEGPIKAKSVQALRLEILNNGTRPENALAIWQQFFMTPESRERMILKEIDKLKE